MWVLMMLVSPISHKNWVTFSSNLSCPDSMQLAWRMVWMRIFLPAPLTTTSSGGFGLVIRLSPGLSRTGTFRCISTLAAAEELMELGTVWVGKSPLLPPGGGGLAG